MWGRVQREREKGERRSERGNICMPPSPDFTKPNILHNKTLFHSYYWRTRRKITTGNKLNRVSEKDESPHLNTEQLLQLKATTLSSMKNGAASGLVLCRAVRCAVLCCAVLCCAALRCAALRCAVLCCVVFERNEENCDPTL